MMKELKLRRKWTFRAHGKQVVFVKKTFESDIHVVTKALVWAIYLPEYPDLSVEVQVGARYKPDLVQCDENGVPVFWGEAGRVSMKKMRTLIGRYRDTHLVFAKWNMNLAPFQRIVRKELGAIHRSAPIDLISFPAESDERFIRRNGTIDINVDDIHCIRC